MPFGLSNPFKKKETDFDPITAGYTQGLLNSMNPMPANEEAAMRDLEINIHTIKDDGITRRLDYLSVTPAYSYTVPVPDGVGNFVDKEIKVPATPVGWALATRFAISAVGATRFLKEKDAKAYKNRQRAEFLKIKRGMRRYDREVFGPAINQLEQISLENIDDSVNGQKMLSLKTSGKNLHVGVENKTVGR
jgi:hypothetical protein